MSLHPCPVSHACAAGNSNIIEILNYVCPEAETEKKSRSRIDNYILSDYVSS